MNGTQEEKLPSLNHFYAYLTDGCNLACRHCWLSPALERGESLNHPVLSVDDFQKAVNEAIPLGLSSVKLTGGEPLLHPDFSRFLEIIHHQNLSLIIETNGLLCTPDRAAEIAAIPDAFVSVSIDGADADTHDRIRGVSGSFDSACEAVRALSGRGVRTQMILSLMRDNLDQIDDVIEMAADLGAESVKFNQVQPIARGESIQNRKDALSLPAILALADHVEDYFRRNRAVDLYFDIPPAFHPLSRIAGGQRSRTCGILGILGLIPGGSYALCGIGKHMPDLVFGKIGIDKLDRIWRNHPILLQLREGLPDQLTGICSNCLMRHRCLGSCIAQNYYRTRNLWSPFWFCEAADRQGLFPESRRMRERQSHRMKGAYHVREETTI